MSNEEQSISAIVGGHICLDIIPDLSEIPGDPQAILQPGKLIHVGPVAMSTGGAVSNTGLALANLGLDVRLMGKVGDDLFGKAVVELLRRHGQALAEGMTVATSQSTSYTVVISPPGMDRVFLHNPGCNDTFAADDLDYDLIARARLFHFGYPPLMHRMYADGGAELEDLLARVKSTGATVSLDLALPDPDSPSGRADWNAILRRILPHVDVFLPSLDEILYMIDRPSLEALRSGRIDPALPEKTARSLLGMGAAIVGIKLGSEGFYLQTTPDASRKATTGRAGPDDAWLDRRLLAPCLEVEVAGTTGAGDCTIAGFLGGLLHGLKPGEALAAAVATGACNVEVPDATSGIPHWDVVRRRLAVNPPRKPTAFAPDGWRYDNGILYPPRDA